MVFELTRTFDLAKLPEDADADVRYETSLRRISAAVKSLGAWKESMFETPPEYKEVEEYFFADFTLGISRVNSHPVKLLDVAFLTLRLKVLVD